MTLINEPNWMGINCSEKKNIEHAFGNRRRWQMVVEW